jgi:hypothetical protein
MSWLGRSLYPATVRRSAMSPEPTPVTVRQPRRH